MTGPCLCGDPACPSCGNPDYFKVLDWVEHTFPNLAEGEAEKVVEGLANYGDLWGWLLEAIQGWKPGDKPQPYDPDTIIDGQTPREIMVVDLLVNQFSEQEKG